MKRDIFEAFLYLWDKQDKNTVREIPLSLEIHHACNASMLAGMLASKYGVDETQAEIAGLIHDIGRIVTGENQNHAKTGKGEVRIFLKPFLSEEDIEAISNAVGNHSDKMTEGDDPLSELIKDVDVFNSFQHGFKNLKEDYMKRLRKVKHLLNLDLNTQSVF